jgi:hypothetical protein
VTKYHLEATAAGKSEADGEAACARRFAKEQECCAFLTRETHHDLNEVRLTITAFGGLKADADELFQ